MIARDPLKLAAARLAAEYVSRAAAWAHDVDQEVVVDLERVHQRIVEDIHEILTGADDRDQVRQAAPGELPGHTVTAADQG